MNPVLVSYGALALAIVSEVIGSSLLARSEQFSKLWPTVGMAAFYIASFFFLSQALKVLPLGFAYAIWAGLGIVLTAFIGVVVFRQSMDVPAMVGIGLIVSGVVVLNGLSKMAGH